MPNLYAISDLHLGKISVEDFQILVENWGEGRDVVIVAGDTDIPTRLKRWPFSQSNLIIIPGNTDPEQDGVAFRVFGQELTVIGCMGANWTSTPWAHFHLHDQPCDPDPILDWIEFEVEKADTNHIMLVLHYPLSYQTNERDVIHPRLANILDKHPHITHIIHGHVHRGCGEIPTGYNRTKFHNVSADRLNYRPKLIMSLGNA